MVWMSISVRWSNVWLLELFTPGGISEINGNNHFNEASLQAMPRRTGNSPYFLWGPVWFWLMRGSGKKLRNAKEFHDTSMHENTHQLPRWTELLCWSFQQNKHVLASTCGLDYSEHHACPVLLKAITERNTEVTQVNCHSNIPSRRGNVI